MVQVVGGVVSCGMHEAQKCSDCLDAHPSDNKGPPMCNGDCKWDHFSNNCVHKGQLLFTLN